MSTSQSLRLQVILGAVDQLTRPLQGMMQGSHKLSGAVKEARDRLRDLEAQQKRIGNYTGATQALTDNARALGTARDKLRALRDQIIATEQPSRELNEQYKATRREVKQLERDNTRLARTQADARTQIERSGLPVSELASRQRELAAQIDRANGQLNEHGRRLAAVRERQREWNRAMEARNQLLNAGAGLLATGTAMGLPIVGMVKDFASFEDAMLGVAKQVEGARDANGQLTRTYHEMADAIRTLSTDARIGQSAVQIASLVEAGARMGIQGADNLLQYARTAGMAATAFDAMADQIGENIAKVAGLYQIPIANIGELGDTINWLDDNAQSKGADIIEVLTRIAGITQTVNMTMRDAAALGSTFLSLGASAEVAATATNAVIRELAIAASQPARFQDALKSLGLAPDAVQLGMLKDSTGTIMQVLNAIKALPAENQLAATVGLFGKEYGDDVAKLAQNMDEYRRQLALANDEQARGSMAREADARAMALSARWQAGMNRLFNASSRAGETLKGTLVGIIETAGRVLEALDGWMQRNPGLASALMHTAAAVAAIVTGMGALALGLAAVIGPFAMLKIGLGVIAPLLAAISAPALIAVAAIAAVGTAGVLLWQNWDTVKAKLASIWDSIAASLGALESSAAAALLRFSTSVTTLWQDVRASTSSALDWLGTLPARFAAAGREMLRGLAEGIANGLGEAKAAIVSAGAAVIAGFKGTLGIRSPSRVFAQLGAHMMSGLSQGLADHEQDPTRTLKAAAQRLAAAAAVPLATIAAPAFAQAPPEIPPAVSESVQRLASMLSSIATPPNYNEPTRLAAPLKPAAAPAQHQQPRLTYHINIDARGAADSSALRAAVRDELEAHRRQLEARRRSILGDVD